MYFDIEICTIMGKNAFSKQPLCASPGEAFFEVLFQVAVFAAQIDQTFLRTRNESAQGDAFNECIGIGF
ncbi:hypothetical protein BOW37_09375 [Solemya velum gill symbiont]|nr:hypothetical protein [Solemya velum gill symbiont]OOZ43803.1 hypothetical protein BOW37_09375 [Solemya velum gill symbiont]